MARNIISLDSNVKQMTAKLNTRLLQKTSADTMIVLPNSMIATNEPTPLSVVYRREGGNYEPKIPII